MKKVFLFLLTILMCGLMTAPLSAQNCDPITVSDETPWFEDFEGYTGGGEQPFQCWIPLVTDATYNGPFVYCGWGASCHSGANSAELKGASNLLVLPDFTNDITTLRLSFWATATSVTIGTLEVGIITDTTDATTFVSLFTCGAPGPRGGSGGGNGNFMGPFDFNAATVTGRIALRYTSTSASQSWNLDDFTVSLIPACAEPSGLVTNNVTAYSADLTWNEISGNTYDLLYWPANGDTIVVTGASLNDGVYSLDNLTPNTAYGWTLRNDCGDGTYANAFTTLSFTTPNIPVELPYEQDFETEPGSITDFTLTTNSSNAWIIGSATFDPENPTDDTETGYSLYISNDGFSYAATYEDYSTYTNTNAYAILDAQFPEDAVEWHISFDYKVPCTSSSYAYMSVYLVDASTGISTSSAPQGINLSGQLNGVTGWTHADYILPNVVSSSKKIVFYWYNSYYAYYYASGEPAAIDNISITSNSCAQPSDLAVTDVTSDQATLTWVENGTATSWTVYWKETGSEDEYTTEMASDTSVTLYNLTPNTHYEFYVVAGCESNPTPLFTFLTPNVPVDLPYARTFEEGDDDPVTEFTILGTGDNQWVVGTATFKPENADDPTETGHSLYISNDNGVSNFYNGTTSYAYAILDVEFDDTPMEYHLAFDYKVSGEGYTYSTYDYLSVYLLDGSAEVPTNANPSGTALLSQAYNVSNWTHADYILPEVTGTSKKIVFYWKNDSYTQNNPPAALDNITIQGFSCAAPSNPTATNITASSATLQWQENGNATSWTVYYRPVGGNDWLTETATDESLEITGLGGNTKYEFYVTADCSGDESNASPIAQFRTECGNDGITVLPFTEDFEGESVNGFVACWTRSTNDSTGTHQVYLNTSETWAWGSQALDFGYTPDCYTQAILPMFDSSIPLNTLKVEFDARRTSAAGAFLIGALTDPEDDDTFVVIDTILTACTGSYSNCNWEHFTVYCNNYTGNGQYLAFRADNCGSSSRLIDNLVIDILPECLPVSDLTVSDPTMEGATISWSGNADSYNVYVGGNVYNTTDTFIVINDLNSSSSYSVTVRAICAADSSVLSNTVSFNTSCGAITVTEDNPWFEDFEGYAGGGEQPFICWETPVTTPGGGPFVYCGYGQSAHSGANTAELKGYTNMLVLPEFSNDIHTLRLSFWATYYGSSTSAVIGVITDVTDTATFEVLCDAGTPGPRGSANAGNGNYMGSFDFNGVQATSGRIAILFNGSGTGSGWNLDDFTVELVPDCPSPVKTSVTATNVDGHNATISWTDNDATHTAWTVYYKASLETSWSSVSASATTLDLTGLDPETTYDVYVVTDCGTAVDNPDATLTIHFTTLVACPAPQNVTVSNIGMTSATVTWFSNADSFTIEYGEAGFTPGSGTTDVAYTTTLDLSGLTSGTAYTIYITADCGSDGTSQTATVNFNTSICEVEDQCAYTFNLIDSYGDGWNGGTLAVKQNGITVATLGLPSGSSATETVNLCHGVSTDLVWTAGSYPSEASFSLTDPFGAVEFTSSSMSSGTNTVHTFTPNCSGCAMPADLTVSGVDANSATISWTGTADSYSVEYGEAGFTPGTGTSTTVTSTTYDLVGLNPATNYTVYVTSDCGTTGISSAAIVNFMTACDVVTVYPYVEGFENGLGCWQSVESTTSNYEWVTATADYYYTTMVEGSYFALARLSGYTAATVRLLSPIFDLTSVSNPYVRFAHAQLEWGDDQDEMAVYYRTSTTDEWTLLVNYTNNISSFTYDSVALPNPSATYQLSFVASNSYGHGVALDDVQVYDDNGAGPWNPTTPTVVTDPATNVTQTTATLNGTVTNPDNVSVTPMGFEWKESSAIMYNVVNVTGSALTHDLSNLTAGTQYTYRAFITYNGMTYYGEDVTFTTTAQGQPTEPTATTLPASAVEQTTATLNGTITNPDDVTITAQGFEWKAASAATYTVLTATGTTMTATLNNLTPNTDYTYRAFVTTANGTQYGNNVTFTTLEEVVEPCDVPTGLTATDITKESIAIAWDNNAGVESWNIQYTVQGGSITSATSTTNSYTITGLEQNTTYQIQVQANCGDGNLSGWSEAISVTTLIDAIPEYLLNSVILYPNPANDVVNVECTMNNVQLKGIEVIDVYGKVVRTVVGANNYSPLQTQINVSDLATGMYFVRVTTEEGVVTKQFVKR